MLVGSSGAASLDLREGSGAAVPRPCAGQPDHRGSPLHRSTTIQDRGRAQITSAFPPRGVEGPSTAAGVVPGAEPGQLTKDSISRQPGTYWIWTCAASVARRSLPQRSGPPDKATRRCSVSCAPTTRRPRTYQDTASRSRTARSHDRIDGRSVDDDDRKAAVCDHQCLIDRCLRSDALTCRSDSRMNSA